MDFETGEIVELSAGVYAEVLWDNGETVDLKVLATGEFVTRTVEELLAC